MHLLTKFGDHMSYSNEDINSYINSYVNTAEKAEIIAMVRHIERFSKSGISIYNSEVPDTADRKTTTKTITASTIAKRYVFHTNAKRKNYVNTYPNDLLKSDDKIHFIKL